MSLLTERSYLCRQEHCRAMTVLQLLLVIVVIVALASLLYPLVGSARQSALQVGCLHHLKQVGIALNAYANDHQERYPATYGPLRNPPDRVTWMAKLRSYAGLSDHEIGNSPYPRSNGIFVCPAFPKQAVADREVSYRYNATIVNVWLRERRTIPFGKVFIVVETHGVNTELYHAGAEGGVARRHPGNAANYLFTDGRVETIREEVPVSDLRWGANRNANYDQ